MAGNPWDNTTELNNISYCRSHLRELCHDCTLDMATVNDLYAFTLSENGNPEYPSMLMEDNDRRRREILCKWWLDIQRELHPGPPAPLTGSDIHLPRVDVPNEVTTVPAAMKETLLQLFHQLQGMTSTQRYYFANQSKILLEDYDIFKEAAVLYEEELSDTLSRMFDLLALQGRGNLPPIQLRYAHMQKVKSSILNTFGFFLELNTHRTFWRAMELTANAFTLHIESFDEEADGQVVVTDRAKGSFLQWLAHFFWSLGHAQFRLNRLRALQYEVYQRGVFPFFPYTLQALEEDSDINLIIIELSKAPLHNFPLFSSLFTQLRQANNFPEQMRGVNAELMAAIDELSSRFRVMENLILVARLVATEDEIKAALLTFKFDPEGEEINSKTDDVLEIITDVHDSESRKPIPKKPSFLQKLIIQENLFRQKHADRIMRPSLVVADGSDRFSKKMFSAFKSSFTILYRESIRPLWKESESSLLGLDVARRLEHRRNIEKKKKKKRPPSHTTNYDQVDMAEVRSVPEMAYVDPSLFWEVGDGTLEKYVPPLARTKIKTRKEGALEEPEAVTTIDEQPLSRNSLSSSEGEAFKPQVQRSLDQLKHTDLTTRDILWRKVKGTLKWSNLVQFLSRLGCRILTLDGSKRKIIDPFSGRCTVLHRPHPGDDCRPDQRESFRVHIEDWLNIHYSSLVPDENDVAGLHEAPPNADTSSAS